MVGRETRVIDGSRDRPESTDHQESGHGQEGGQDPEGMEESAHFETGRGAGIAGKDEDAGQEGKQCHSRTHHHQT